MTSTDTLAGPGTEHASSATPRIIAAVAAVVFGVALFVTVAAVNVPHHPSDGELLRWWQDGGNRTSGVVSGFAAICVATSYPIVAGYLCLMRRARRSRYWSAFARAMVAAVSAVWLVTGAVRATVGHLVGVMDEPLPDVDSLRLVTALNYTLLGLSGMAVLGLSMLALSVVVLRSGAVDRWVGYVGLVLAVLMLAAVVAQYGAFTTPLAILWSFCLAVALWRLPDERDDLDDLDGTTTSR